MNANDAWIKVLRDVFAYGHDVEVRGLETKETIAYQSIVDMEYPVVSTRERKINYKFLCGEAWWILDGSNLVGHITPFMKSISKFSDNGIHMSGAYGPKVVEQLNYVCQTLNEDKYSRQAIINIWRENPRDSKDIPCTLSLQFLIRNNKLHCVANMRSSDVWLGWVYDVFNFSMISAWVAICLRENSNYVDLGLGDLYLRPGSQHIYDSNYDDVVRVLSSQDGDQVDEDKILEFNVSQYTDPETLKTNLYNCGMGYEYEKQTGFFKHISKEISK